MLLETKKNLLKTERKERQTEFDAENTENLTKTQIKEQKINSELEHKRKIADIIKSVIKSEQTEKEKKEKEIYDQKISQIVFFFKKNKNE